MKRFGFLLLFLFSVTVQAASEIRAFTNCTAAGDIMGLFTKDANQ